MGTRNLTCVVLNNEVKVAQYCQWDGYPDGQGETVVEFICSLNGELADFKQAISECKFIDSSVVKERWNSVGADPNSNMVGMDISKKFQEKWPELDRDAGADILEMILNKNVRELKNEFDFGADSLFCEYAYVLDLDNEVLECYKGFNKAMVPKSERFASLEVEKNSDYQPIKLFKKYHFGKLEPGKTMKALAKEMYPDGDE